MRTAVRGLASIRHLVTPRGTRGVEVAIDDDVDRVRSIAAAIGAIHTWGGARAEERSAAVATAFAERPTEGLLVVRVWGAGSALRVELTNPPDIYSDELELLERLTDRWGLIDLDERTVWFEVSTE